MKNQILCFISTICFCACQMVAPQSNSWEIFTKCAGNNCIKEVIAVKDAFLKNPQPILTEFQATYEKGEDHVIGWLFILRDSVLMNPKMGTVEARYAMQQAVIAAAKPFEKDVKVHEMAQSVINELKIAAIKGGKVIDPMAAVAPTTNAPVVTTNQSYCYQYKKDGVNFLNYIKTISKFITK
jgi:hypothetical protein